MSRANEVLFKLYRLCEADIETIARNPPTWVPREQHAIWADVVRRGKHTNYGGAVNHFKRSLAKHHGQIVPDRPVQGPAGQSAIEKIANNPPRDLTSRADRALWKDIVTRGKHSNYGGARAHFNAHKRKYALAA